MRVTIVYESMFGNTRVIAEAIAQGMGQGADVRLVRVADTYADVLQGADLVVAEVDPRPEHVPAGYPQGGTQLRRPARK